MCVCACVSCAQKKVSSEECLVFVLSFSLSLSFAAPFFFRERESRESFSRSVVCSSNTPRVARSFFSETSKKTFLVWGLKRERKFFKEYPLERTRNSLALFEYSSHPQREGGEEEE